MKSLSRSGWAGLVTVAGFLLVTSQAFADRSGAVDILRQGLLGAGTGAISAGSSGGNAGKGALIGAGTNVIGGAILGLITEPSYSPRQQAYGQTTYVARSTPVQVVQPVYRQTEELYAQPVYRRERHEFRGRHPRAIKEIVRQYDIYGRLVSERIIWK